MVPVKNTALPRVCVNISPQFTEAIGENMILSKSYYSIWDSIPIILSQYVKGTVEIESGSPGCLCGCQSLPPLPRQICPAHAFYFFSSFLNFFDSNLSKKITTPSAVRGQRL